ncbi:DUF2254 domain-containing protein [Salinarimonas rosea]|uniref:DUF2254 domain-containing protein n=1 Tax=Salinarimonas rosea TaxID=552063 RepID=UPI000A04F3DD|nr:DUF2254 domain-containing protein [Salinarimonas rosea]
MRRRRTLFRPVRSRLATLWDAVQSSLWFIPGLMSLAAAALAVWLLRLALPEGDAWGWLEAPAAAPSDFVATLLSSMITMATLAISITMVVLTLAANQLGFRLIRNFIGDRRTQVGLGLFLATIVYLLVVLRGLPPDAAARQAAVAVTGATVLVLASVAMLLFYVHHLARSIVADTLVHRVGDQLDAMIEHFLPDLRPEQRQHPRSIATHADAVPLYGRESGYIQAIDYGLLVRAACEGNCVVELAYRPGHHILAGGVHARVTPPEALTPALEDAFGEAVVVGPERTPVQDLEFAFRQLVEIGLRALSPSLNDAFTGIAVINRLGRSIATVLRRPSAERGFPDQDGIVRVISPVSTFQGLVDVAFHQIRRSAAEQPAVLMHLLETLAQLAEIARDPERKAVIAEHVDLAAEAGRRVIAEPRDLAALEARRDAAVASLTRDEPVSHKDGLR